MRNWWESHEKVMRNLRESYKKDVGKSLEIDERVIRKSSESLFLYFNCSYACSHPTSQNLEFTWWNRRHHDHFRQKALVKMAMGVVLLLTLPMGWLSDNLIRRGKTHRIHRHRNFLIKLAKGPIHRKARSMESNGLKCAKWSESVSQGVSESLTKSIIGQKSDISRQTEKFWPKSLATFPKILVFLREKKSLKEGAGAY